MKVFQVLKPGLFTSVQDLGRHGYLRFGVPISGAMDTFSLTCANLLVANDPNDACLETTLIGPELQVLAETQIAIAGGNCSPKINGKSISMWRTLSVQEGDVVSFGKMEDGCRTYISIRGGIDSEPILGSRSTYVRGGFGGINGRQLKTGDAIDRFDASPVETRYEIPLKLVPRFTNQLKIHVVMGPQSDMFTENGIDTFLSEQYTVTSEADRMGYRLEGPIIEHKGKAEIVSDALLPGAIQVPRNGRPIAIMRDAQTTGGYPKIAVATTADVDLLGQAKPNDTIKFLEITLREACEKLKEHKRLLGTLETKLKGKHKISKSHSI